jgi:CheY-like chemotaxis protein
MLLEANLFKWGYEVMVAPDGGDAWEIIQQPESTGLIVSNRMMPRMNGLIS